MRFDFTSRRFFAPTPGAGGAPTPEDIANAEKLLLLLQKVYKINEAEARQRVEMAKAQGTVNEELKVYQERLEDIAFQSDYIFNSFRETTAELKGQNNLLNISKVAFKKMSDIASDINYYQRGATDLTDKQFKKMGEGLKMRERDLALVKQRYEREGIGDKIQETNRLRAKGLTEGLSEEEKKKLEILSKETEAYQASVNALELGLPLLKRELEFSKKIADTREGLGGIAGAAAGALSKYGGSLASFLNLDDARQAVEDYNKELIDQALKSDEVLSQLHENEKKRIILEAQLEGLEGDARAAKLKEINDLSEDDIRIKQEAINKVNNIGNKFQSLKILTKGLGEGLIKSLKDPLTAVLFIFDSLLTGSKGIAGFQKSLGVSYGEAYKLNTELNFAGNNVNDAYINGEKLKKSFSDLAESMGFVADYGTQALVSMTNLTGKLGLSNQEAAQLTTLSRMQSTDTEAVLDNVGKTVTSMNKQGKTSILLKDVMKEIATVSKATAVSLGSNPVKIAEAVVAAKQLGTTMQQLESTADSLLDFQSSIQNELEAELLTGKQMNLERARAAALANDMKTLAEEIGKNEEVIGAFASGNRLAQEASAKALGMSREQLAEMVYKQEAMTIGAEGVRAKYGEQAYEALKAQDAQEKFANAVEKLKTAFSSIVQIFSPIIDALAFVAEIVASIVSKWYILYPLLAGVALMYMPKIAAGFGSMLGSVGSLGKSIKGAFSMDGVKGWFNKVKEGFSGTKSLAEGVQEKVSETVTGNATEGGAEAAEKTAGTADKVKGDNAAGFKEKMQNIAEGIKAFGDGKVLFGAFNLIPSSIGLIAMIPGIIGIKLIEQVKGEKFQEAMYGIAYGIEAFGSTKITGGAANLILSSIGLIAMIPGVLGAKLLEQINGEKLKESLTGLAEGLAEMGTGKVLLGSLALVTASIGLIAMIPGVIGGALLGISGGLIQKGLMSLASGLTEFGVMAANPLFWLGIAALAAFNLALIPLGYTLKLMAPAIEAFGKAIKSTFEGLATVITAAANGVSTIFNSLQNVDVMKLLAIGPALIGIGAGLAALGAGGVIGAVGAFLGGDPIKKLQALAASGDGLTKTATALQAIAGALAGVSAALSAIDVSKLEALDEFSSNQATNAVVSGITNLITAPIKAMGESVGGPGVDLTPMIAAINEVRDAVNKLYNKDTSINMDSKKVGTTLVQNTTRFV